MQTLLAFLFCCVLAAAQSTFSPARPPAIPLAVKSPYLTTWLNAGSDGGNGGYLANGQWPSFWKFVALYSHLPKLSNSEIARGL